ncbi:Arginase/deacetylase [Macroventuria anomochaeta]|uniref:Arginase/deacetylase n=1 Tax=Macroventuria anomochaeta TaxID=301207 RepID=A0ACB6RK79_9PLEO|nr:Arginase/deacetylase [Macroventuria anomochaeta]KAF2621382.1 Arginase/deacetylase [Macroventuria anomochaeta]
MQSHQQSSSSPGAGKDTTPRGGPRPINNESNSLSRSVKRLSLHTSTSNLRDPSPGPASPRLPKARTPSSPLPQTLRRSSSTASLNRASSPAPSLVLGRKSSSSSLRGDINLAGTPRNPASRRSSFAPNMPSPIGAKSPLQPHFEEKPPLRACDVAEEHFKKELARHEGMAGTASAGTIVIVHDHCYGHRYSRPKTPKNILSLIMERPERILASVLGISTAYVRLGGRHAQGYHPLHPEQNPPNRIPFKIRKTSRVVDITSPVVTNVHGTRWMEELKSLCDNAGAKLATTGKELARDGPTAPGQPPKHEFHAGDLYLCQESLDAFQGALGGVLDAVDAVFQGTALGGGPSRAFVCVRPPGHHCSAGFPSGFCWLNNVHVGIEHAMMQYGLTHAAIIDFDLHHGDGSQAITWARNKKVQNMPKGTANRKKTSIGYFSLHDINSYPCEDGDDDKVQAASLCIDNAHGQSIWNVHLQSWKTPEEFWAIYEDKYLVLLDKTRQYLKFHTKRLKSGPNQPAPKAAIFLSAGFDASEWETAGMQRHAVNVPTEFYARFTRDVVRLAEEEGTAVDGRVISVLEGGYSDRALASGVMSHISGLTDGQVYNDPNPTSGLALDMHQRLAGLSMSDVDLPMQSVEAHLTPVTYDPSWWHATHLAELENLVNPPPPVAIKKPRQGPQAHFSSPTQSFTAKVVDPTKLAHLQPGRGVPVNPLRPTTPPPPDVDWATAAHALSALLVPSDRQTRSCRPEELAPPQVKKEKPAAPALASVKVDPSGRQLRGRKPVTSYADAGSDEDKASLRTESRSSRRQTIADFQLASAKPPPPARPVSRRMSIASSVSSIGDRSVSRGPSIPPPTSRRRSVAPSTAPSTELPVKKGRGTTSAASSRAPQRPPPVARVPSAYSSKVAPVKGKENDDMDSLTSGLKRVTLKMPSKEEYEAREREKEEKQKALEASKKTTTKTTTRKAPANRTTTTKAAAKPAAGTAKRGPGRTSKSSKTSSPATTPAPSVTPEPPKLQSAATAPLEQPEPVQPEPISSLVDPVNRPSALQETLFASVSEASRRGSGGIIEPPTDIRDSVITPEQLREQLPLPSFVTEAEAPPTMIPPQCADTPPPPPPATGLQFVNYNAHSFDTAPLANGVPHTLEPQTSAGLRWLPPNTDTTATPPKMGSRPMSPAMRQDLPLFTANSIIPFAVPAPAPAPQQSASIKAENYKDVWEVPDTPAR